MRWASARGLQTRADGWTTALMRPPQKADGADMSVGDRVDPACSGQDMKLLLYASDPERRHRRTSTQKASGRGSSTNHASRGALTMLSCRKGKRMQHGTRDWDSESGDGAG